MLGLLLRQETSSIRVQTEAVETSERSCQSATTSVSEVQVRCIGQVERSGPLGPDAPGSCVAALWQTDSIAKEPQPELASNPSLLEFLRRVRACCKSRPGPMSLPSAAPLPLVAHATGRAGSDRGARQEPNDPGLRRVRTAPVARRPPPVLGWRHSGGPCTAGCECSYAVNWEAERDTVLLHHTLELPEGAPLHPPPPHTRACRAAHAHTGAAPLHAFPSPRSARRIAATTLAALGDRRRATERWPVRCLPAWRRWLPCDVMRARWFARQTALRRVTVASTPALGPRLEAKQSPALARASPRFVLGSSCEGRRAWERLRHGLHRSRVELQRLRRRRRVRAAAAHGVHSLQAAHFTRGFRHLLPLVPDIVSNTRSTRYGKYYPTLAPIRSLDTPCARPSLSAVAWQAKARAWSTQSTPVSTQSTPVSTQSPP